MKRTFSHSSVTFSCGLLTAIQHCNRLFFGDFQLSSKALREIPVSIPIKLEMVGMWCD